MIEHEYSFRVMYPDTDKMGTVHHSQYAIYYEAARWELFRSIGIPYQMVEESGYMFPVLSMNLKFLRTTHYDARLKVKTTLKEVEGVRMWFTYKLYNENDELINAAETELACVSCSNWKPSAIPDFVLRAIELNQRKESANA